MLPLLVSLIDAAALSPSCASSYGIIFCDVNVLWAVTFLVFVLFFSNNKLELNSLESNLDDPEGVKLKLSDYF